MLRVSLSSIDIPDVELMNSPLCNNLVKALALQRSREKYAVRPASPDSPTPPLLLPTLYCCLTTSSKPPPPPSSSVISIHPYRTIATNPRSPHPRFEMTLLLLPSLRLSVVFTAADKKQLILDFCDFSPSINFFLS